MNSGDVTAISAVGSLLFMVLCAIIKGIVDSAVSKKFEELRKWLDKKFDSSTDWQTNHLREEHGRTRVK